MQAFIFYSTSLFKLIHSFFSFISCSHAIIKGGPCNLGRHSGVFWNKPTAQTAVPMDSCPHVPSPKGFHWPHPLNARNEGWFREQTEAHRAALPPERTNHESLREGWKRRRQDSEGSRAALAHHICCTSAVPTVLKHFYTLQDKRQRLMYLPSERQVCYC